MTALPRYVWRVTKPNDRAYLFYAKFRGTPAAWPIIRLPDDANSAEFGKRVAQCETLSFQGGGFAFTDAIGRAHPLPAPDDAAFWSAVDKAEEIGKRLAAGERKVFSALIFEYRQSNAYLKEIVESTRSEYDRYIDAIERVWGGDPVAALTPVDAQKAIDSYKDTPSSGRMFRSVLSRLIGWGIPRGYSLVNPVENTEHSEGDGTYEPWEAWQFELYFQHSRPGMHLPVFSSLFTGQRAVDVFKMRLPLLKATEMPIFAQKTSEFVPVQIHSEYRQIINTLRPVPEDVLPLRPEDAPALHLREDGEPWIQTSFETAWQRMFKPAPHLYSAAEKRERAAALAKLRGARTVFHGLRKNAVINLLEAGCTEKMVEKIVGMSAAMVEHYSKRVNARRLAIAAMKQLESSWGEQRQTILRGVSFGAKQG